MRDLLPVALSLIATKPVAVATRPEISLIFCESGVQTV